MKGVPGTSNVDRVEAPVTLKAYMLCVFASFGGIFFGYVFLFLSPWSTPEHPLFSLPLPPSLCIVNSAHIRYDSGYMNGVLGMRYFITLHTGLDPATTPEGQFTLPAWQKSLITSVLSAGTFFGALIAGDMADIIGRRWTVISGCAIFIIGNILQTASAEGLGLVSSFQYLVEVG